MPRNVYCDQCKKAIENEKLAWFSNRKEDLDFCSENCYLKWDGSRLKDIDESDWADIHPDFTVGLQKSWKDKGFGYQETKQWIKSGLLFGQHDSAFFLKKNGFTPEQHSNFKSNNNQEYLDHFYPLEKRIDIRSLDIGKDWDDTLAEEGITNLLLLEKFKNLRELICSCNKITELDLSSCPQLQELACSSNQIIGLSLASCTNLVWFSCSDNLLTGLGFLSNLNSEKLESLNLSDNNFSSHDLSSLSKFINLRELYIGNFIESKIEKDIYNRFYGSLKPLKDLVKLEILDVSNTDIELGIEYLPSSLVDFYCDSSQRESAGCQKIIEQLEKAEVEVNSPVWKRNWKAIKKEENKEKEEEWKKATENAKKVFLLQSRLEKEIKIPAISERQFGKIVKEKINIKGEVVNLYFFATWFNPNCAVIINSKRKSQCTIRIIIYEPKDKKNKEILKVIKLSKHKTLLEAEREVESIKEKMNSNSPILVIAKKNFFINDFIEKFKLDSNINPEEYLKPLDIVWRRMADRVNYHAAIYLGNGQVVHISGENKKNFGTGIDTWDYFLKGTKDKLIRHHIVIPFKSPEKILEHIARTTFVQHAKNQYNMLKKNCEHFATLCICGVSFSEQADKVKILMGNINLEEEIEKSNKIFETVELEEVIKTVETNMEQELRKIINIVDKKLTIGKMEEWYKILIGVQKKIQINKEEIEEKLKNLNSEITGEEINWFYQANKSYNEITDQLFKITKRKQLQSVTDWTNIHFSFTLQLIQVWTKCGFTPFQTQEWINIIPLSQQAQAIQEPTYYAWLRDEVRITPEELLNELTTEEIQGLRESFQDYQEQQQSQIPPK